MSLIISSTSSSSDLIDDLMYDMDESLFDFDFSQIESQVTSLSQDEVPVSFDSGKLVGRDRLKSTCKPWKGGVTKLKKKPTKRASRMLQGMVTGKKIPNMSRRSEGSVLVAFPTFDKCDSLVFLPTSYTRFMNNADIAGMTNLIRTHATKDCGCYFKGHNVHLAGFIGLNQLSTELHPDAVNCVAATKVINNTVQAKVYTKFTECETIFDSVAVMRKDDAIFKFLFGDYRQSKRIDRWKKKVSTMEKSEDEKEEILNNVITIPGNLLVYGSFVITFTFDDILRKVNRIDYDFEVTSLSHASESVGHK